MREMPRYDWTLLRAGRFKLDGGGMFGVIPRVVWGRAVACDEKNRIEVQHNCVLLREAGNGESGTVGVEVRDGAAAPRGKTEGEGELGRLATSAPKASSVDAETSGLRSATPGSRRGLHGQRTRGPILLEVGTGNKLDAKMREIFALEDRWVADALGEVNTACEDIAHVVVSHLHFDHAGGLTRLPRPDEDAPPYPGALGPHRVVRSFPNAEVIVQRREWADAIANNSVMTRTYYPDHLEPVESQVRLIDTLGPWGEDRVPGRDQDPALPLEERMTEVLPGVFVFRVPGHTWGQQATLFTDTRGRPVVFTPDLMPTAAHVGATYSLSYDVEPYVSMVTKRWFLAEAERRGWVLVLDHEPGNPVRRVRENGKGWYELEAE